MTVLNHKPGSSACFTPGLTQTRLSGAPDTDIGRCGEQRQRREGLEPGAKRSGTPGMHGRIFVQPLTRGDGGRGSHRDSRDHSTRRLVACVVLSATDHHIRRQREIRFITARGDEGRMRSGIKQTPPLGGATSVRRANRRLNGRAETAGLPDPPARGRLTRTLALLDAALKVWETNHPRRAPVARHQPP